MLSIDKKRTERLDMTAELKKFVQANYSPDLASDHESAFAEATTQREGVRNAHDRFDEAGKGVYFAYFVTVLSMERRFPISESHLRFNFTYFDAFSTRKKTSDFGIYFEKVSLLFNLAAHLSKIGATQNLTSPDGLRTACQNFQMAAGALTDAKSVVDKHPLPPSAADLSTDVLAMLIMLMLAQAQQCFYEKAALDKMKPQIIAKLAMQASDFYQQAQTAMGASSLSFISRSWKEQAEFKKIYYKALAQLQQSHVAIQEDKYGEQVGRLIVAAGYMDDAKRRLFKSMPAELQTQFNVTQEDIAKFKAQAEKENDTIYHDTVPSEARLGPIEAKAIVKPTPLVDQLGAAGDLPDLFAKLVPFAVTEKLSIYQDRRDTLVRDELRGVDEANQIAIATLSSMGLPGAIEALDIGSGSAGSQSGLPAAVVAKQREVVSGGGLERLAELKTTARQLSDEARTVLDAASKALDDEEAEDSSMRAQYKSRWSRTPSHQVTSSLRQEISKYRGHLEHATKSDALVDRKFDDNQLWIGQLSGSVEDIVAALPAPPAAGSSQPSLADDPVVVALKSSLGELDRLVSMRMGLRTQIQDLAKSDDPSSLLLSSPHEESSIYEQGLEQYRPLVQQLHDTISQQTALLDRISTENASFGRAKDEWQRQQSSSAHHREREKTLQLVSNAHSAFVELMANLAEGIQFYTEFQNFVLALRKRCDDFAKARSTEKGDFLKLLQAQATAPQSQPGYGYPPSQSQQQPGYVPQQAYGYPASQQQAYGYPSTGYPASQQQQPAYPPSQQQQGSYPPQAAYHPQQTAYAPQSHGAYPPQQAPYMPQAAYSQHPPPPANFQNPPAYIPGYGQQPHQQQQPGRFPQQPSYTNQNSLI